MSYSELAREPTLSYNISSLRDRYIVASVTTRKNENGPVS